jgi:hypothetical protein
VFVGVLKPGIFFFCVGGFFTRFAGAGGVGGGGGGGEGGGEGLE